MPQFKEIFLKNDHHCGAGVSIIGIYYTIFSKVLCSAFCSNPPPPPSLMRKATCKYILRALLTTIVKVCTSKQFPFYRPKLKSLQPSKSCL